MLGALPMHEQLLSVVIAGAASAAFVLVVMLVLMLAGRRRWRARLAEAVDHTDALEERFAPILNVEREALRIVDGARDRVRALVQERARLEGEVAELRSSYAEKRTVFDRLSAELAIYDDRIAWAEMGVYRPHFDFDSSEDYKAAIERVREKQKRLISDKAAVICRTNWHVEGSLAKGKQMTDRNIRLTLRAFNGECDAAIANTRWNNANAMEKRVENARTQIDKHNASNTIEITEPYFKLKVEELRLTHEFREKVKAEREERAESARAAKEEQKLIREMERAEEEEARYQRMLQKARAEAASVVGPRLAAYTDQIAMLERDLAEAHAKVERAHAMAEMTKTGYVYVISNVGSFGPDFVKIGLTRRLDPADRIRELGDASVPFLFDTHAMIYSEDAPRLERALHVEFAEQRVNATNMRKEFFRVSIEEVEAAVKRLAPTAPFFRDIEAQEYRETMALRNAHLAQQTASEALAFPASL
jgi:predicted nuclease with TOPRIM domain